jgi:GNAT superfamily N-acetyltransferase
MMHVERIPVELTRELRHKVLWPHIEHTVDCRIATEESTPGVFHLATFDGTAIVSVGTFFPMQTEKLNQAQQYRLRAMATLPEYEGKGCGRMLLHYAFNELRQQGVEVLWCDARIKAIGFYQNLGFELIDEIYEVPKIGPHKFMWKLL